MSSTGATGVDGRTARRDRNRDAVLDAMIALFGEGSMSPSAAEVAERSGVSLRSVFRYFDDTEALLQAATTRHFERIAPLYELPGIGEGPLDERIDRFVAARLTLYDAAAPIARVAIARMMGRDPIARRLIAVRDVMRAQTEAMFAPELQSMSGPARRCALAAVDTLFQFEAIEHLNTRLGLTRAEVRETLRRSLAALLY